MVVKILTIILALLVFLSNSSYYFGKNVWVHWNKPINQAPIFQQLCYQRMKLVCQKQGWKLTLLSDENLKNYLSNYDHVQNVIKSATRNNAQAISDYIRLSVIQQHGGVYFDMSSILFQGLTWLQQMGQHPHLVTNAKPQTQPDMIVFYISMYQQNSQRRNQLNGIQNWNPGYQAWFLSARAKSKSITGWKNQYQKLLTTNFQKHVKMGIDQDFYLKNMDHNYYLTVDKSSYYFLQTEQHQLDKSLGLFQKRKNINQQLNIWGIHGQYGPLNVYMRNMKHIKYIHTLTLEQMRKQYFDIKFYNKITKKWSGWITSLLWDQKNNNINYTNFQSFLDKSPSEQDCDYKRFIVQGSIMGILVQNSTLAQQNQIQYITVGQRDKWNAYCQGFKKPLTMYSIRKKIEDQIDAILTGTPIKPYVKLYEQQLSVFGVIGVIIQANQYRLLLFGCIGLVLVICLAVLGLTTKVWYLFLCNKYYQFEKNQSVANEASFFTALLIKLSYFMLTIVIVLQYYLTYALGQLHKQFLLLLMFLSLIYVRKQFKKHLQPQRKFVLGVTNEEFQRIVQPIITYCLGRCILYSIQYREQRLFHRSIIICFIFPQLYLIAKNLTEQNNSQTSKVSKYFKIIIARIPFYTNALILAFLTIVILVPNTMFMFAQGQGYRIRKFIWIPLGLTFGLYIMLLFYILKQIKPTTKKIFSTDGHLKFVYIKKARQFIKFIVLTIIMLGTFQLPANYQKWILFQTKAQIEIKYLFIFITLNISNCSVFQSQFFISLLPNVKKFILIVSQILIFIVVPLYYEVYESFLEHRSDIFLTHYKYYTGAEYSQVYYCIILAIFLGRFQQFQKWSNCQERETNGQKIQSFGILKLENNQTNIQF